MSTTDKAQALVDLVQLETQVAALRLRLLACADDVADQAGARDVGAWLAHQARLDRGPARRDGELATALEERWHRLQAALGTGALNLAQARVCVQVLGELPEDLEESLVDAVEEQLVILAEQWAKRPAGPGPQDPAGDRPRDRRRTRGQEAPRRGTPSPGTHQPARQAPR
jgi:hypothetical protein